MRLPSHDFQNRRHSATGPRLTTRTLARGATFAVPLFDTAFFSFHGNLPDVVVLNQRRGPSRLQPCLHGILHLGDLAFVLLNHIQSRHLESQVAEVIENAAWFLYERRGRTRLVQKAYQFG